MDSSLSAKEIIRSIVGYGLAPALKSSGFKKSGLTFTRRVGSTGQFVQVQLSRWNQGSTGSFYLNIGVMFDQLHVAGHSNPSHPKYEDCQFMTRLERLVPEAPAHWPVDASTSVAKVSEHLTKNLLKGVIEPLNTVASLHDFEGTGWVNAIPWGFPAQYAYALHRDDEAAALITAQAEYFSDRGVTRESLIRHYGLTRLQC